MRLPFQAAAPAREYRQPARSPVPELDGVDVAAVYRGARTGGDFFEFLGVGDSRLLVLLLDIAGKREEALHIAAGVQDRFRELAPQKFRADDLNEAEAVTETLIDLNQAVIRMAGGVRCAPGFLGCYNRDLGTITYVNAGHTPALLRDGNDVMQLESNGLPLGLFSHATHEAQLGVLSPGATLLLVSKGLVESRSGREEFGIQRVREVLGAANSGSAESTCHAVLEAVQKFVEQSRGFQIPGFGWSHNAETGDRRALGRNDATTLALVRKR